MLNILSGYRFLVLFLRGRLVEYLLFCVGFFLVEVDEWVYNCVGALVSGCMIVRVFVE